MTWPARSTETFHGLKMKIPTIPNVLRAARRVRHAAKSTKPAIKEIKTPKERERERERERESHFLHRRVRRTWDWEAHN